MTPKTITITTPEQLHLAKKQGGLKINGRWYELRGEVLALTTKKVAK